jgi:hypothetical protein
VLWDAHYVGRTDIVLADMVSIGAMGYISDEVDCFIERCMRYAFFKPLSARYRQRPPFTSKNLTKFILGSRLFGGHFPG